MADNYDYDYYCMIAGTQYTKANIKSMSISGGLFSGDKPTIGGVESRQLTLVVIPQGEIPWGARISVHSKKNDGEMSWQPSGVFFVNTRRYDYISETLTLNCYDVIAKMDMYLYRALGESWKSTGFSWGGRNIMQFIASYLQTHYNIYYFYDGDIYDPRADSEDTESTGAWYGAKLKDILNAKMRTVAGWIAAASGGNLIADNSGYLRLVPFNFDVSHVYNVNLACKSYWYDLTWPAWSGVKYIYSGMDDVMSGDETGAVVTAECPFATTTLASNALAFLNKAKYYPFQATGALIPPYHELGSIAYIGDPDTTPGQTPFYIAQSSIHFGGICPSDIGAPDDGVEEIPVEDGQPFTDEENHKIKETIRDMRWVGTESDFNALTEKDNDVIYYVVSSS